MPQTIGKRGHETVHSSFGEFSLGLSDARVIVSAKLSRFSSNSQDIEDVLSDALYRFLQVVRRGKAIRCARSFFSKVVEFSIADFLRRTPRPVSLDDCDEPIVLAERSGEATEQEILDQCAEHLESLDLAIIRSTVLHDLSCVETAEVLGLHPVTIRNRRRRALAVLADSDFVCRLRERLSF